MAWSTKIVGTGSYLPPKRVTNNDFLQHHFHKKNGERIQKDTKAIVKKLKAICEIEERRYAADNEDNAYIAHQAAAAAIKDAGIDKNTLDQIIFAHNVGNAPAGDKNLDLIPNLAARIKNKLGITNENCVAYDILFGCPGWVQGVIQTHMYFSGNGAQRTLVIGSDVLSRFVDNNDLDSMLFSDGAGAAVLERQDVDDNSGVLSFKAISSCESDVDYIYHGKRILKEEDDAIYYLKMNGRGVYRFGLEKVPAAISECLKMANVDLKDVSKFLIHQANGKMIKQMIQKLFEKEGYEDYPAEVLPLSVQFTGNSSVATVPTLLDLIKKGELDGHEINKGDVIVLASVGSGMHANCVVYRV